MQVKTFEYLVELARCGSFYRAAKNLGVSQQGLSKAVAALEAELGAKLVERNARGIRLTHDGEVALSHALQISDSYNSLVNRLQASSQSSLDTQDRVKVYVSYYSAQIAAADPRYVGMLEKNLVYTEEPFEKLVRLAELSDGSDLVFADVQAHTLREILNNKQLKFLPLIATKTGFIWQEGSPLEAEQALHRETVSRCPVAVNTARESALLLNRLFANTPLQDVRLGTTSPRLLLQYARASKDTACVFDSFGFYLAEKYSLQDYSSIHFTPLSTPDALELVGFLMPASAKLTPQAKEAVELLRRFLRANCSEYFEQYPLPAL